MTFPVVIEDVNLVGGNYVLTVDDIYHAQPTFTVTIGATVFKIADIDADASTITVTTTATLSGTFWEDNTTFNLYTPYFFHGTPLATSAELLAIHRSKNKTPMIWFLEQFKERFYNGSPIERESTIRIFFLTQAKHNEWQTDDAYHQAIQPMHRLAENFIDILEGYKDNCRLVFDINEDFYYDTINFSQFGVYINMKGTEENLFAANQLSGCETPMLLKVKRLDC